MLRPAILCAGLLAGLGYSQDAQAQMLNMDLSEIVNANMQFDQQMTQQAADVAQQWYNERQAFRQATGYWGYLPGPVSAMDLHRSVNDLNRTYADNNRAWHDTSSRTTDAIDRWVDGAIRGVGPYSSPSTGATYQLPWTHSSYWIDQYNQYHPGYWDDGYGVNVYPAY